MGKKTPTFFKEEVGGWELDGGTSVIERRPYGQQLEEGWNQ
jgi:hypothetical protein